MVFDWENCVSGPSLIDSGEFAHPYSECAGVIASMSVTILGGEGVREGW